MAVLGRVEVITLAVSLGFQENCTILSFDEANALNSIYLHRMLPALVEVVLVATHYDINVYAREPPKLLFAMDGYANEIIPAARGVQQGCNLVSLCYRAGSLKILREFRIDSPVPRAQALTFIDRITVILLPESAQDTAVIAKATS